MLKKQPIQKLSSKRISKFILLILLFPSLSYADTLTVATFNCEFLTRPKVYIKFGLRNAPDVYPSGTHLENTVIALSRERVRRAEIGLSHLKRYDASAITSTVGQPDLGIPQV